ncbi:hypothetical protein AB1Y20_003580 [Prymnesium parvum]|uniref:RING-type domain-containing protein n=1 Tax=Prymnesium parvum TaxID=97485 RepID=A0AB34J5N1_PRYPA
MSFLTLISSTASLLPALLSDFLGLATRPVVLLGQAGFAPHTAAAFAHGGLLTGLLGTVSSVLIGASVAALVRALRPKLALVHGTLAVPYLLDALAQLPRLLSPFEGKQFPLASYPCTRTGAATVVQLCASLAVLGSALAIDTRRWTRRLPCRRLAILASAACLRFTSARLGEAAGVEHLLYALGCVQLAHAATPAAAWAPLARALGRLKLAAAAACSFAYLLLEVGWRRLAAAATHLWTHPWLFAVYASLVAPAWRLLDRFVAPWLSPLALAAMACSCGRGAIAALQGPASAASAASACALGFCSAAAALSSCILALRASISLGGPEDPLRVRAFASALAPLAWLLASPVECTHAAASRALTLAASSVWPRVAPLFKALFTLAVQQPLLSIPSILAFNVGVLSFSSAHASMLPSLARGAAHVLLSLRNASLTHAVGTDSNLALLVVGAVQGAAYRIVSRGVQRVRAIRCYAGGGAAQAGAELASIAESMSDPRQCGRCAFGPVDYSGCSRLTTHHGELSRGGASRVSNACPRCGWFAPSLEAWPRWDRTLASPAGLAVLRQRVWSEIGIVVRASSKALLIPYAILKLSSYALLPEQLACFLVFSYIVPWAYENSLALSKVFSQTTHRRQPRARAPPPSENAHCAGSRARQSLPHVDVDPADALTCILTATPARVLVGPADVCSICLDEFSEAAVQIAASKRGADASQALLSLDPAIVSLRCGHALHVACAREAVMMAERRHVRCPLCREPATLSGVTTARMFS